MDAENVNPEDLASLISGDTYQEVGKPISATEAHNLSLQAEVERLKQDKTALLAEFAEANEEEAVDLIRKRLLATALGAVDRIAYLALHADSESVQSTNSRYIIDLVLSGKVEDKDGALKALFEEMRTKPADKKDKAKK